MRILLVSWEYPPVIVGGLGRHVHHLAIELSKAGHDVVVVSRRPTGSVQATAPTTVTTVDGVRIVAAAEDPPHFEFGTDMMAWTLAMGHSMIRAVLSAFTRNPELRGWAPEVVHAHDWLVAHPAIALAEIFDTPLVATIHATEAGRHSGWLSERVNQHVHSTEWWLTHDADALICCSHSMKDEVKRVFHPTSDPIVIHNGIDTSQWPFRDRQAEAPLLRSSPPRLLFVGRLEYEKGLQDLIAALPRIRSAFPGTTLTVAGLGTQENWLRHTAREHRVHHSVFFSGHHHHSELVRLLHHSDLLVIPSRYEPFGIVALEGAACGTPIVSSTSGGLSESVQAGKTGYTFEPGDIEAITSNVRNALVDWVITNRMARSARAQLTSEYGWSGIAARTAKVYQSTTRRPRTPLPRPAIIRRPLPERH